MPFMGLTTEKGAKKQMDEKTAKIKQTAEKLLREYNVTDEDAIREFVDRLDEGVGEDESLAAKNEVQGQAVPNAESAKPAEPSNKTKEETNPSAEGAKPAESQGAPETSGGEAPKAEAGQTAPQGAQAAPQTQPAIAPQAVQPQQPLANVEELQTKIDDQNATIKSLDGRLKADEELLSKFAQMFGVKSDGSGQSVAFGAQASPEAHQPDESDDEEYKAISKRVGAHWEGK